MDRLAIDAVGVGERVIAKVQRIHEAAAELADGAMNADAEPVDAQRQARKRNSGVSTVPRVRVSDASADRLGLPPVTLPDQVAWAAPGR